MLDAAWRQICEQAGADDLAADLLSSIITALFLPPETGMSWLGDSVGEVLRRRAARPSDMTPFRPDESEPEPMQWHLSTAERQAIAHPEYADSADYHYAQAAAERALREKASK